MTHRHRRFIFWTFVVIFFVLTFFISLYAVGYRVNLTWPLRFDQILQKTGAIFLDSEPTGAFINITDKTPQRVLDNTSSQNNKQLKTPAKLKSVLPGNYEVTINLDGYWTISKNISVYPGETTYIEHITLFKKNLPAKIIDAGLQAVELTDDKNHLILKAEKKIINLKTESEENVLLKSTPSSTIPNIIPNKFKDVKYYTPINNNEFLYATDFEIYHFDINQNKKSLVTRTSEIITGIIWQKDNYLIYSSAKNINLLNLNDKTQFTRLISLEKIMPPVLSADGDILYFTAKIGLQESLYKLSIK